MAVAVFHGATSVERVSVGVPVTLRFHRHTLVLPSPCLAYEISSCFFVPPRASLTRELFIDIEWFFLFFFIFSFLVLAL